MFTDMMRIFVGLRLFSMFDRLVELHYIMKIETIGDCYIAAGGMLETGADGFYQVREAEEVGAIEEGSRGEGGFRPFTVKRLVASAHFSQASKK